MSQPNFDPNQQAEQYNKFNTQDPAGYQQDANGQVNREARNMACVAHISILLSMFAPLIMWFIYKDKPGYGFTKRAAARAFNMSLTATIASFVIIILSMILFTIGAGASSGRSGGGAGAVFLLLGGLLYFVLIILLFVITIFHIIAAVKTYNGQDYKYPLPSLKVLKA